MKRYESVLLAVCISLSCFAKDEEKLSLKKEIITQILLLNPSWNQSDCIIQNSKITRSQDNPFISINIGGSEIRDLSLLRKYNLSYLKIHNTSIKNLDFLYGIKNTEELFLELVKNESIEDYSALKNIPLKGIMIKDQLSFKNTEIIDEKTEQVILENTGIKKLAFVQPKNLRNLSLSNNSLLVNIKQIEQMKNLEGLLLGNINNDFNSLLENLPKLSSLAFIQCSIPKTPRLQKKTLKNITIFKCKNLNDLSSLDGKNIEKLILLPVTNRELKSLHDVTVNNIMRIRLTEKLVPESLVGIKVNGQLVIFSDEENIPQSTIDFLNDRHIDFIREK